MNKTKIEWTDWTWNPVTGCLGPGGTPQHPMRCSYCYAERMVNRFPDRDFNPTFHEKRLAEPAQVKHPVKVFVCSMADLFGDWVPQEWIEAVLNRTQRADYRHHTYQFLTKNPKRLKMFNPWPDNCWVGTTVTNQADADERLPWLLQVEAPVRFVSHEPLLGQINDMQDFVFSGPGKFVDPPGHRVWEPKINWAIIGAMTGAKAVLPKPSWVVSLEAQYQEAGIPIFEKDNLKPLCGPGAELVQRWPDGSSRQA